MGACATKNGLSSPGLEVWRKHENTLNLEPKETQAVRQSSTPFIQLSRMIPNSWIQNAIAHFDTDRRARSLDSKAHLFTLLLGHLRGVSSLRHLVTLWQDQPELRRCIGLKEPARSTLADANRSRSHQFFRALAAQVLHACLRVDHKRRHRLSRISYCLDSTSIELSCELFSWALVSSERAAIKFHTLLRSEGALPELTTISEGERHDLRIAKMMEIPSGSIVSMDRAYVDTHFLADLHDRDIVFVTRMKRGMKYKILRRRPLPQRARGIRSDWEISLTGNASAYGTRPLRRVSYRDPQTGQVLVFLTNSVDLSAGTIARLYKDRWQVELFFKWIKQNLKIRSFWGRSRNAVLTQLWVALLAYALVSWINLKLRTTWTRLRTLRFVQDRLLQPLGKDFWVADQEVAK